MSRFQFSLESLRRYQEQVQSMAELRLLTARRQLEQAKQALNQLQKSFNETAAAISEGLVQRSPLLTSNRELLKHLGSQIPLAEASVQNANLVCNEAQREMQAATTKLESYETLREREREACRLQRKQAEANQLLDTIMRSHHQFGENVND